MTSCGHRLQGGEINIPVICHGHGIQLVEGSLERVKKELELCSPFWALGSLELRPQLVKLPIGKVTRPGDAERVHEIREAFG